MRFKIRLLPARGLEPCRLVPVPLCRGAARRRRAAEARGAPAADEEGEQRGRKAAAVGGEGEGGAADADAGCWILKHD